MGMRPESQFWQWLRPSGPLKKQVHCERIEQAYTAGTPDVEFYWRGRGHGWIELKATERPKNPDTLVRPSMKNRAAQISFMRRRWDMGDNACFVIRVGHGLERMIYIFAGDAGTLLAAGMTEKDMQRTCLFYFDKSGRPANVFEKVLTCHGSRSNSRSFL